jgi:NAD(P)-dependent dehydrogenase (short-subunit alcohol dehydrogenase family)
VGELDGKVALITGAAQGIGRAAALLLHGRGAAVAVADVNGPGVEALAADVRADGGTAEAFTIDMADSDAVARLVDQVVERCGHLDILVNNAGVTGSGPLLDLAKGDWDRALAANLTGPFLLIQAFGRHAQVRGGGGRIVNLLSSSVFRTIGTSGPDYVATKAGLLGLTRTAAGYLAPLDINVNAISPGFTDTPRVRVAGSDDEAHAAMVEQIVTRGPMANLFGRPSVAEDVADAIVFLCLPASRQITGQVIHTSAGAVV